MSTDQTPPATELAEPSSDYVKLIPDGVPPELATLSCEQIAHILGRSTKSIKVDITRNPQSLPPTFRVPGSRKIRFRVVDVQRWMDALSQLEIHRRQKAREAARSLGVTGVSPANRPVLLASKRNLKNFKEPLVKGVDQ